MPWIALHLPQLPLQALLASLPGCEATRPLAVVERHRLVGASRAARARGVRIGLSNATALALLPTLVVQPRDPAREAAFVETLALALAALTPRLVLAPSGVLLEVASTLRLFGGLRALQRRALALAQACGAQVRLACAPTAAAACPLIGYADMAETMLRHQQGRLVGVCLERDGDGISGHHL